MTSISEVSAPKLYIFGSNRNHDKSISSLVILFNYNDIYFFKDKLCSHGYLRNKYRKDKDHFICFFNEIEIDKVI